MADLIPLHQKLKEPVDRLHALLAEPEPGILSWNMFVGQNWKAIADLFYPQRIEVPDGHAKEG